MVRKTKAVQPEIVDPPTEQDDWTSRAVDWLQDYGAYLLYGIVGAVVVLLLLFAWNASLQGAAEVDYLKAEMAFQRFQQVAADHEHPEESEPFQELTAILRKYPNLRPRYDGLITQVFLRVGDVQPALLYGERALKQLSRQKLPFYEDFSKTSLLVAEGNYRDALRRAVYLDKKMAEHLAGRSEPEAADPFGVSLQLLNLVRIASLNAQLEDAAGELQALTRIEFALSSLKDSPAADELVGSYKTGKVGLEDYIADRKKMLRQ